MLIKESLLVVDDCFVECYCFDHDGLHVRTLEHAVRPSRENSELGNDNNKFVE